MIDAVVTGNVGKVNELRVTQTGKAMLTFSVASTEKKDGLVTWVDVACFDEQAETCAKSLQKGMRVVVAGRLALEVYDKKDGSKGHSVRLMASDVGVSLRWPSRQRSAGEVADGSVPDEEIPF